MGKWHPHVQSYGDAVGYALLELASAAAADDDEETASFLGDLEDSWVDHYIELEPEAKLSDVSALFRAWRKMWMESSAPAKPWMAELGRMNMSWMMVSWMAEKARPHGHLLLIERHALSHREWKEGLPPRYTLGLLGEGTSEVPRDVSYAARAIVEALQTAPSASLLEELEEMCCWLQITAWHLATERCVDPHIRAACCEDCG
jgi:hypothetical protein